MTTNRIVTRGMGASRGAAGRAGLVTMGFGGVPPFVPEAIQSVIRRAGQSGTKRRLAELDHIIAWAKLVSVNDKPPVAKIEGTVTVPVSNGYARAVVEHVSTRAKSALEVIRVTVKRLT